MINKKRKGLTLVELAMTIVISLIIVLTVAIALVDSNKAWGRMYGDVFSDTAVESLCANKTFDSFVRKASSENISIDPAGNWVEVYFYSSDSSPNPDRYARFYLQNEELVLDWGVRTPKETIGLQTLCHNVSNCKFSSEGRSVQMFLTLDDDNRSVTVASSAILNN
jgi:hypothetical protein